MKLTTRSRRFLNLLKRALKAMPKKELGRIMLFDGSNYCAVGAAHQYKTKEEDFQTGRLDSYYEKCLDASKAFLMGVARENDNFKGTRTERWDHMRRWTDRALRKGEV